MGWTSVSSAVSWLNGSSVIAANNAVALSKMQTDVGNMQKELAQQITKENVIKDINDGVMECIRRDTYNEANVLKLVRKGMVHATLFENRSLGNGFSEAEVKLLRTLIKDSFKNSN